MSGANSNNFQHLSANCPKGTRPYTGTGRPFTPADLKPRPLETHNQFSDTSDCSSYADITTQDFSRIVCNKDYSGRAFNPALDISGNRLKRSQNQYQYKPPTPREYEMARNKEFAIRCLRAQQAAACRSTPMRCERQSTSSCKPQTAATSRESPNVCMKPGRVNTNTGRRVDVDRVYDHNMQACSPARLSGRALDLQRDLTFRRLNLPTPKQHRAISCATPAQYGSTAHSPIQRMPRIFPRPSQSVSVSPTRSISPSEATVSRYATAMQQQRAARAPEVRAKYPVIPQSRPINTPVYPVGESSIDSSGTITKIVTTTTTTNAITPQQAPICPAPQTSPDLKTSPYDVQTHRRKGENISHITHDNTLQMDSAYGLTPPRGFALRSPLRTPQQPLNVTQEQSTSNSFQKTNASVGLTTLGASNAQMQSMQRNRSMTDKAKSVLNKTQSVPTPPSLPPLDSDMLNCRDVQRSISQSKHCVMSPTPGSKNFDQSSCYNNESYIMKKDYRPVSSRTCPSPMQPRSPQVCPDPTVESYYYNASMLDAASKYRKMQVDKTQYQDDNMDISGQELFARSACPLKQENRSHLCSWRIPPEDLTCYERSGGFNTYSSQQQPDFSSTMVQTMPQRSESLGGDFEATEYQELPSSLKVLGGTSPPCEQQKASLFRCLAKKLSTTYDFISSLVAPQKSAGALTLPSDQMMGQVCDATNNATRAHDTTTFGLRNVYARQGNDTTLQSYDLNTLFGNKTQSMDKPTNSIRECANAKRCGRVQFDSSDKGQVQDPQRTAIRKAEIENLVNDTYCPGIIQETIDGVENFNNYSFNISLGDESKDFSICIDPPAQDPMTLLEAFAIRIEKERAEVNKNLKDNSTQEQIEDYIQQYFATQNPSDLNRSIKSLLISEHLQKYEQLEKTKSSAFKAEVHKLTANLPNNAQVKLAFIGHAKP